MKTLRIAALALIGVVLASLIALTWQPESPPVAEPETAQAETAIFAGGCFWCMEYIFEKLPGVVKVETGYIGGHVENPTYAQVSSGLTGHVEAIRVRYDPAKTSYPQLLDHFWHSIDPTVDDRQFCNVGSQYRTGIYYLNEAQRQAAQESKEALEKSGQLLHVTYPVRVRSTTYPPEFQLEAMRHAEADAERESQGLAKGVVRTEIVPAGTFYLAEEEHQDYYLKHPIRFGMYRIQCGRPARLKHIWGSPNP